MPVNVIMPQMGESVAEGTITRWMKKPGDRVERDEPLFEITTDKVDAEIPSPAEGVLSQILAKESETVPVNAVVAIIESEAPAHAPSPAPAPAAAPPPAAKPVGAAPPLPQAAPPLPPPPAAAPPVPQVETGGAAKKIRSSPLVRRIAEDHKVDLAQVTGTGLGGRISKQDILAYIESQAKHPPLPAPPAAPPAPLAVGESAPPAPSTVLPPFTGPVNVVPMTPMRRQIAEHMAMSKRTSAHVATVFEVEMTRVAETMRAGASEFERRNGIKITYTPFFVRAAVEALKAFPILNSSLDGNNIVYRRDINIGIAVALETGLIVPVIKQADEKNFLGVTRALRDLASRARSKRLSVDEVQGGTFTITNPGIFGSLFGTPVINQPQVAILGVGTIEKRAVVRNDAIAIRPMVYLSLSFDHRLIDGAIADQFMGRIKGYLEKWEEPVF
jgi:pyruvate dehydrogenase E2 component (dihydrolipoamide acetyltransferase)